MFGIDPPPMRAPGDGKGDSWHSAAAATRVLLVIPTLNEAANISRVIGELTGDVPEGIALRIVVADGGSTDGTIGIVEKMAARHGNLALLHNPQRLQSAAINLAVARYGDAADVLIRCDAHAHYPAGFIDALLRSQRANEVDAVVVPMDTVGDSCLQRAIAWVSNSPIGSGGSAHRGGARSGLVDHGHHALFMIDRFKAAGGYDPSFSHNEDAELDCRQRAIGSRIYLDASVRVRYTPRRTLTKLARQYFNYGHGRSRTIRRHPRSVRARQLAIPMHVLLCAALPLALITPLAAAWPLLYSFILLSTSASIAVAQRSPCGLLAGPAAATMHFAWGLGFLWGLATLRDQATHGVATTG